jgi:hypothetical protein
VYTPDICEEIEPEYADESSAKRFTVNEEQDVAIEACFSLFGRKPMEVSLIVELTE